jgi:hypothetical protein
MTTNETWTLCSGCHQAYQVGETHVCLTSTTLFGSTVIDPMAQTYMTLHAMEKQRADTAESLLQELLAAWDDAPYGNQKALTVLQAPRFEAALGQVRAHLRK